jgi:hypothetical protein
MSSAVIQFCASAFASYANSTQIFDVFGNQVRLRVSVSRYQYRLSCQSSCLAYDNTGCCCS